MQTMLQENLTREENSPLLAAGNADILGTGMPQQRARFWFFIFAIIGVILGFIGLILFFIGVLLADAGEIAGGFFLCLVALILIVIALSIFCCRNVVCPVSVLECLDV
jgi:Co/Zn/Cd efflux system component